MIEHSLPLTDKTPERIKVGYDSAHFGENYWTTPDSSGNRRIDRKADTIIALVRRLVQFKFLPEKPMSLDIGAGPGNMVRDFRDSGLPCMGCEYSESGRRLAKEHFSINLQSCDLRNRLPYEGGIFDFAFCVGVLSMIPRDRLLTAFQEMARILRPDGILHISLLNPKTVVNEPHLTSLRYEEWWRLARDAGLTDVTSLWPPQRCGIGMNNEFCGLFMKGMP